MDNVAFWGTITDGERVTATFGPGKATFESDLGNPVDCEANDIGSADDMACYWTRFLDVAWTADAVKQEFTATPC